MLIKSSTFNAILGGVSLLFQGSQGLLRGNQRSLINFCPSCPDECRTVEEMEYISITDPLAVDVAIQADPDDFLDGSDEEPYLDLALQVADTVLSPIPMVGDIFQLTTNMVSLVNTIFGEEEENPLNALAEKLYAYVDQKIEASKLQSVYGKYDEVIDNLKGYLSLQESNPTSDQYFKDASSLCMPMVFGHEIADNEGLLFKTEFDHDVVKSRDRLVVGPVICNLCISSELAHMDYGRRQNDTAQFNIALDSLSLILHQCMSELLPAVQDAIEDEKANVEIVDMGSGASLAGAYQEELFSPLSGSDDVATCVTEMKSDLHEFWNEKYESAVLKFGDTWAPILAKLDPNDNGLLISNLSSISSGESYAIMSVKHGAFLNCPWSTSLSDYDISGVCAVYTDQTYFEFVGSHDEGFYIKLGNNNYLCEPPAWSPFVKRQGASNKGDHCLWKLDQPNLNRDDTLFRISNVASGNYLKVPEEPVPYNRVLENVDSYWKNDEVVFAAARPMAQAVSSGENRAAKFCLFRPIKESGEACDWDHQCESNDCSEEGHCD